VPDTGEIERDFEYGDRAAGGIRRVKISYFL
jgi:hypothetical protein